MSYYKFYIDEKNKMVIAATHYAGRKLRATAKCAPEDEFDIEFGKRLAMARCELKVAKIKKANATVKFLDAAKRADEADRRYNKMKQYYIDADDQIDEASENLSSVLKEKM